MQIVLEVVRISQIPGNFEDTGHKIYDRLNMGVKAVEFRMIPRFFVWTNILFEQKEFLLPELEKTVGEAGWAGMDQEFGSPLHPSGYIEYTIVYIGWEFEREI